MHRVSLRFINGVYTIMECRSITYANGFLFLRGIRHLGDGTIMYPEYLLQDVAVWTIKVRR